MNRTIKKNMKFREVIPNNKTENLLVIELSNGNNIKLDKNDAYQLYLFLQQTFGKVDIH